MAFVIDDIKSLNAVTLYSQKDTAIDHDATDWEEYAKDPMKNEGEIKFKDGMEPTRFIFNFEHKGKVATHIDDSKYGGIDKESKSPKVNITKWAYEVMRHSLKDIQNPPNVTGVIKIKLAGDKISGTVVDDVTMTKLKRSGLVEEMMNHYLTLTKLGDEEKQNAKN